MAKSRGFWGIDIGQVALKALRCHLSSDGQTVVASKYDFIEYPKILSQPEADPEELIQEALQTFLSRNSVVGDQVAICVSGQAGLSRFFKPPPVELKMLPDIVKYEVKQQIPFPIDDVIWDWQQLGGSVVEGRVIDAEVGLFAMKRDAVFRALRPFDDAEVEVDCVQLSPLAVFNYVCHDMLDEIPNSEDIDPENPPPSRVVMAMGTDTTDLVVTNGLKLWLRNIPIGGNHFTRQLSRELKLTQTKAEHLKRNARNSENPKAVFKAMRPVFNDLVNEVQRSLTFFQSIEKTATISEIVLLGNAAKLPGLRQFLNSQLEIEIAKASEFQKLEGDDVVNQPSFKDNLLSFAPCYGLCIQGLKKGRINTNLLPREIVVERIIRAKKPWVLASVSALAVGLLLGWFFFTNAWWRVNLNFTDANNVAWQQAIQKMKTETSTSSNLVAQDSALKETLQKFKRIAKELSSASEGKSTWIEIFSALYQALPRDERIEKLLESGSVAIDPVKIGFDDRKELYIDHIESVYYKDLGVWDLGVDAIYKKMDTVTDEDIENEQKSGATPAEGEDVAATETPTTDADAEGEGNGLAGKSGWVIEILGHHFHNSPAQVRAYNSGKTYLLNTLIKNLREKTDVVLPTPNNPNNQFSFEDLGIYKPTITRTSPRRKIRIEFDPAKMLTEGTGGLAGGSAANQAMMRGSDFGTGGTSATTKQETPTQFDVHVYNFVVQMAWVPRTPSERVEARETRLAAEAERLAAAQQAAAENADTENVNTEVTDETE